LFNPVTIYGTIYPSTQPKCIQAPLHAVLTLALAQMRLIQKLNRLMLPGTGINRLGSKACFRIHLPLQTLRATPFNRHCIGPLAGAITGARLKMLRHRITHTYAQQVTCRAIHPVLPHAKSSELPYPKMILPCKACPSKSPAHCILFHKIYFFTLT
jgi:hypothetical protein